METDGSLFIRGYKRSITSKGYKCLLLVESNAILDVHVFEIDWEERL